MAAGGGNLYWADQAAGTIMQANLDGSNAHPFLSGLNGPVGVAVDGSHVYWANLGGGNGTINAAPLAGGTATALVTGQSLPVGVAVGPS